MMTKKFKKLFSVGTSWPLNASDCFSLMIWTLQKDDSIRELTDRLFFGADRFKAYINEKTTPRNKPHQAVTDNYYTTNTSRQTQYSTSSSTTRSHGYE